MNKRSMLPLDVMMWGFVRLLLIVSCVIFVAFTVHTLIVNDVGVENLRAQIFTERILSSTDCFSYYNGEIDRYYPNIVDINKFKNGVLEKCIDYGDKKIISAKLTLNNLDTGDETAPIYYNKDEYYKWLPFSFKECYLKSNRQRYVLIMDKNKVSRGKLEIDIITPIG